MQTVAEIRSALQAADARQFDALVRALAADERKGVRQALEVARRRIADEAAEEARIRSLYDFQRELAHGGVAVGLDEVGRGPLAGPLAVGAVVLPDEPRIEGIDDSKKLAPSAREELSAVIRATAKSLLRHGRAEVIGIADGGRGAQVDTRVGAELGRVLGRMLS